MAVSDWGGDMSTGSSFGIDFDAIKRIGKRIRIQTIVTTVT